MTLIFGAIFLKKALNPLYLFPGSFDRYRHRRLRALEDSKKTIAPTPVVAVVELSTRGVHRAARNSKHAVYNYSFTTRVARIGGRKYLLLGTLVWTHS